jgi:hypothetical protein
MLSIFCQFAIHVAFLAAAVAMCSPYFSKCVSLRCNRPLWRPVASL